MTFLHKQTRPLAALSFLCLAAGPGVAHEAWLLTPAEIADLATAPIPELFRSQLWLGVSAALGLVAVLIALQCEHVLERFENRALAAISLDLKGLAPLLLRLGLSVMLILAALGGLPRHGTEPWVISTYLVPDMQLSDAMWMQTLAALQMCLGLMLLFGIFTRAAGVMVVFLSLIGPFLFGLSFLSYSLHFAAPGLLVFAFGPGKFALEQYFVSGQRKGFHFESGFHLYRISQVMMGIGFIYLGVAYKLFQPTLLIAILEHGEMPTFGLPMAVIALIMTGVEILCGALLVLGRLIRPVSLAVLGAISFLAIVLAETPLFHANLYGTLLFFLIHGRVGSIAFSGTSLQKRRAA